MAWIESHQTLARHPKVIRLAARLKINKAQAIGHLHLLWWWTLDYAPHGDVSAFASCELGVAAEWTGDADGFLRALTEAGWVDEDGTLHDWHDYAGKLVEERTRDRERKRQARLNVSGGSPVEVRTPSDVPNPTAPNPTKPEKKGAPVGAVVVPDGLRALPGFDLEWNGFVQCRKTLKKPLTDHAKDLVLKELGARAHLAIRALQICTERGWQGIKYGLDAAAEENPAKARHQREQMRPVSQDPAGCREWLAEHYPGTPFKPFREWPRDVQREFEQQAKT